MQRTPSIKPAYSKETKDEFSSEVPPIMPGIFEDFVPRQNVFFIARKRRKKKSAREIRQRAIDNHENRTKFNELVSVQFDELRKYVNNSYHRVVFVKDKSVEDVVVLHVKTLHTVIYCRKISIGFSD